MPRINRIRLHNIRYPQSSLRLIIENQIFDFGGSSGVLILQNGFGKSLILQLIAQSVIPNAVMLQRSLHTLFEVEAFTGHVLVEWRLDEKSPRYLLTGFCFTKPPDSRNDRNDRKIDYFNYVSNESYSAPNAWDLESFPIIDENRRTLNYSELRARINASGGKVRSYGHERRRDYYRLLGTYNIEYKEWEEVARINARQNGLMEYFETAATPRTLLGKLIFPAIDSVLNRDHASTGDDELTSSFNQYSQELMRLPQLKVTLQALEELTRRIPDIRTSMDKVTQEYDALQIAIQNRQSIYNTMHAGLPKLEEEKVKLKRQQTEIRQKDGCLAHELASIKCESLRRQVDEEQNALASKEEEMRKAQSLAENAEQELKRDRAWQKYGEWQDKDGRLRTENERKNQLLKGQETAEQEIDGLRQELWPLHLYQERQLKDAIASEQANLNGLNSSRKQVATEKKSNQNEKQLCEIDQARLTEQNKGFAKEQAELQADLSEFDIEMGEPEEMLRGAARKKCFAERHGRRLAAVAAHLASERDKAIRQIASFDSEEKVERGKRQELENSRNSWRQSLEQLNADLTIMGINWRLPLTDVSPLKFELKQHQNVLNQQLISLGIESNRIDERKNMLQGQGIPNQDISQLQDALKKLGVESTTGSAYLKELADDDVRKEYVTNHPWLPYALVAEESQLSRLLARKEYLKIDLSSAVPVAVRSRLLAQPGLADNTCYFFYNQGLEPFIYPFRLNEVLNKLDERKDQIAGAIKDAQSRLHLFGNIASKLGSLIDKYGCIDEGYWAEQFRQIDLTLENIARKREDAKQAKNRLDDRHARATGLEQSQAATSKAIQHIMKKIESYKKSWLEHGARKEKLVELSGRIEHLAELIKHNEEREAALDLSIAEAKERLQAVFSRKKELDTYQVELFPKLMSQTSEERPGTWDDYRTAAGVVKAKKDALSQSLPGLEIIEDSISGLKKDMRSLERDIADDGQDFANIAATYREVTDQEVVLAAGRHSDIKGQLDDIVADFNKMRGSLESHRKNWQNECRSVEQNSGRKPLDLQGVNLEVRAQEIKSEQQKNSSDIQSIAQKIEFGERLHAAYTDALENMKDAGLKLDNTPVLNADAERRLLQSEPDAPRQAAREGTRRVNSARARHEVGQKQWSETILSMIEILEPLSSVEINRLFGDLKNKTATPGWESDRESIRERLDSTITCVDTLKKESDRRMADTGRIMQEIVARTYRHAISAIDELKHFQRLSKVELRGEMTPLILIDIKLPNAEEGKERMYRHVEKIISSMVTARNNGDSDEAIKKMLTASVTTIELVDQLVPIKDIKINILKPRDNDANYRKEDYEAWSNVYRWSQAQGYVGRFSVYVVLMGHT